jgi:lambda family phage portal protein
VLNADQSQIFQTAVNTFASQLSAFQNPPQLYGPDGRKLQPSHRPHSVKRDAAKKTGSLKDWNPQAFLGKNTEAMQREEVVKRCSDLVVNDPHAAGITDTFAVNVVGPALTPLPAIDHKTLNISREHAREIEFQMRSVWNRWEPHADTAGRLSFGALQFQAVRQFLQFGEFFCLYPMIESDWRYYSLTAQMLYPTRIQTAWGKAQENVRDGIELDKYGGCQAVFVSTGNGFYPTDFQRIPMRKGHRLQFYHGFDQKEPEQVRGWPMLTPVVEYLKNFNDLLNSELVSAIVTAAFSMWVDTGPVNPFTTAGNLATYTQTAYGMGGDSYDERYQELIPGQIMYGAGKPTPINPNRPSQTFDPFTKILKKSIALGLNMPHSVIYKDVSETNYAGFRSAMLEAWKTYSWFRSIIARWSHETRKMLMEEAYLMNELNIPDFYENIDSYCNAMWIGPAKGNIEPIKEATADIKLNQANLKTKRQAMIERGLDPDTTYAQLQEEREEESDRGLNNEQNQQVNNNAVAETQKE